VDTVTAVGRGADPQQLGAAASALAHLPLEHESLDVSWHGHDGAVLARFGGASGIDRARTALAALQDAGLDTELVEEDGDLWAGQTAAQRSSDGVVVRVSTVQTEIGRVLEAACDAGARAVGRGALGLLWVTLPDADPEAVRALRARLAPAACVVLDAPVAVREAVDPWGDVDPGLLALMRSVKARFDPLATCNPGLFVGGI
jgi:hypothetical protein